MTALAASPMQEPFTLPRQRAIVVFAAFAFAYFFLGADSLHHRHTLTHVNARICLERP